MHLHFASSLWPALFIIPVAWLLWRQFPRGSGGLGLIWIRALQIIAIILLIFGLTKPQIRKSSVEYHPPAVLLAMDLSQSFDLGSTLNLENQNSQLADLIQAHYKENGFDVFKAFFHSYASSEKQGMDDISRLGTDFGALSRYIDSASFPNLRAIFLFTDGWESISQYPRKVWELGVPVYPLVFDQVGLNEVQPLEAVLKGENDSAFLSVIWNEIGNLEQNPVLDLLRDGKQIFRFRPNLKKGKTQNKDRLQLEKDPGIGDFAIRFYPQSTNPISQNDSMKVTDRRPRYQKRILVTAPLVSLGEKVMIQQLHRMEGFEPEFVLPRETDQLELRPTDQIWISTRLLSRNDNLKSWIKKSGVSVVVYGPGSSGFLAEEKIQNPSFINSDGRLIVDEDLKEFFYNRHFDLRWITNSPVALPWASDDFEPLIKAASGAGSGTFLARFHTFEATAVFRVALPEMWPMLFRPRVDPESRSTARDLFQGIARLAGRDWSNIHVNLPDEVYHQEAFVASLVTPPGFDKSRSWQLGIAKENDTTFHSFSTSIGAFITDPIMLPEGSHQLVVVQGETNKIHWSQNLRVLPLSRREMSRIGYNQSGLREFSSFSQGKLLNLPISLEKTDGLLPNLPEAQVRNQQSSIFPLYNTPWIVLIVAGLLILSWLLRKRFHLD